jgi:putative FmdB family regulatory protein
MPIYAYKCSACGHTEDALQKMSAAPLTVCPACGQSTYAKQLTAPQFQLKGSGWYVTDFRGGNGAKDAKKDDAAEPAKADANATAGSDGKTETKTDSKAESKTSAPSESGAAKPAPSTPAATPAPAKPVAATSEKS